jgi:hypothetical protein
VSSFSVQSPNLQAIGPVVRLQIAVGTPAEAALRKAGTPIPTPVTADAMIDTGATASVIAQGLAGQIGLQPVGSTLIATPSHANLTCFEYFVRLVLPQNVVYEGTVIEAPMQGHHIQCLIGRDILAHSVFVYTGYLNLFTLSF